MNTRRAAVVLASLAVVVIVSITCFNFFCFGQQLVYTTISVSDARAMLQFSSNVLVVDVRTTEEYAQGHLKGAINIPLSDLPLQISGLEQNRPILVYCQTGYRSAQASSILVNAGFTKVYNLEGGITAWINSGYPTVNP
ncbi:MAG: rhodanese-like domain-containing protein [Candidatus Bathyarchaeia archaeon]